MGLLPSSTSKAQQRRNFKRRMANIGRDHIARLRCCQRRMTIPCPVRVGTIGRRSSPSWTGGGRLFTCAELKKKMPGDGAVSPSVGRVACMWGYEGHAHN